VIVPDEQSWIAWGLDPVGEGLEPVLDAGRVRRVLLPDALPEALARPLAVCLDELPLGVRPERRSVRDLVASRPDAERPPGLSRDEGDSPDEAQGPGKADPEHQGGGDHDHAAADGDHEDLMAITGEPSADGLVMEPIKFSLGPLRSPLPGGMVVEVELDGDVVAECAVRAILRQRAAPAGSARSHPSPDLLAPASWAALIAGAAEADANLEVASAARWLRVASVELERTVSHLGWLRALARLLGWADLIQRTRAALAPLLSVRASLARDSEAAAWPVGTADPTVEALAVALTEMRRLQRLCGNDRRLASRTAGRGRLSSAGARRAGLRGVAARASGIVEDVRSEDPLYLALAFEPLVREEGDALARTLLRLDEASVSIGLTQAALARAHARADAPAPVATGDWMTLEGPRGPLRARQVRDELRLEAPGQDAALAAAGPAAVGLEWAAALVVLISFDLSPWLALQ